MYTNKWCDKIPIHPASWIPSKLTWTNHGHSVIRWTFSFGKHESHNNWLWLYTKITQNSFTALFFFGILVTSWGKFSSLITKCSSYPTLTVDIWVLLPWKNSSLLLLDMRLIQHNWSKTLGLWLQKTIVLFAVGLTY